MAKHKVEFYCGKCNAFVTEVGSMKQDDDQIQHFSLLHIAESKGTTMSSHSELSD